MIIADGISMMYLQTTAFAYENIYVECCSLIVDDKTSYVASRIIYLVYYYSMVAA